MEQREKAEFYLLILAIAVGLVATVVGFIEPLNKALNPVVPNITAFLLAVVAGSLLFGTYNTRQFLKSVLPTGTIIPLESDTALLRYIFKRMQEAKKSICDMTWAEPLESTVMTSDSDRDEYAYLVEDVSKRVRYREIMMFCGSEKRIKKARRLIANAGKGYQLAGFADIPKGSPCRWQFVIIDDEEVILDKISIKQPEVVDYFRRYYDSQWSSAIPIRIGDAVNLALLEEAERKTKQMS